MMQIADSSHWSIMKSVPFDLCARGPVVTDGAWGTQLQARGLALGEFPTRGT